jgi:tryptophanyl-tRNA synthetase
MSLTDPTKKMSKTGDEGIALSDSPDQVRAKIKRAATDSGREVKFDEVGKSGISNLLTMYAVLSGKTIGQLEEQYTGKTYAEFKADLSEVVVGFLQPLQERRAKLAEFPSEVERILTESEEKAKAIADTTLADVHKNMGLR